LQYGIPYYMIVLHVPKLNLTFLGQCIVMAADGRLLPSRSR